jgi:hypothetical protein
MARKSAELAARRVAKVNMLRERHERLLEQLARNEEAQRKAERLAFEALPEGFAIALGRDEPWEVVNERREVV